jgi:dTMP kinase
MSIFITLDGIDGTGKSTQCRMLVDWLVQSGRKATLVRDPGGTALCNRAETLLFMASRAQLVHDVVEPAVRAGQIVVSDRFIAANVVYQGHAASLKPEEIWPIGGFSTGGLMPTRSFILDLPVDEAIARRGRSADRMESRGPEYMEKVRRGFLVEAERDPSRFQIIDARGSIDDIQSRLRTAVSLLLEPA